MNPWEPASFSARVEYLRIKVELVRPVRVPSYIEDLYKMAEIQQREDAQAPTIARVPEPQSQGPRMRSPPRRTAPEGPVSEVRRYRYGYRIPPRFIGKQFPRRGGWVSNYSPKYAQESSFPPDGNQYRPRPSTGCMTPNVSQRPAPDQKATQEATASVSRNAVPETEPCRAEPKIIVKQTQKKRRKKRRKKNVPKTTLCEETSASNNEASVDSKPSTTKQSEAKHPEKQE